jgi:hypothetical protein
MVDTPTGAVVRPHHTTSKARRGRLYGSPKVATRPPRLDSADGAFWHAFWSPDSTIEDLNLNPPVLVLLIFAPLPDCSQNKTAVSDTLRLLSDF